MGMRGVGICVLLAFGSLASVSQAVDVELVRLAREAVASEVKGLPPPTSTERDSPKPVFVTIERNGRVLGCRGALATSKTSLQEEAIYAARAAARHDPRYRPITPNDLNGFLVTVTVVDREEPITAVDGLRPEDGLIVRSGNRTGIVLPWEGKDPKTRLRWAYAKAGVPFDAPARLSRLIADRTRG